jgi:hypothetical protein
MFDPITDDLDTAISQACEALRESFRAQVGDRVQQARRAGFRRSGPWTRKPDNHARVASRLFQRAVLGWSYEAIADAESQALPLDAGTPDATAIRMTTRDWAKRLGIPLPTR